MEGLPLIDPIERADRVRRIIREMPAFPTETKLVRHDEAVVGIVQASIRRTKADDGGSDIAFITRPTIRPEYKEAIPYA